MSSPVDVRAAAIVQGGKSYQAVLLPPKNTTETAPNRSLPSPLPLVFSVFNGVPA